MQMDNRIAFHSGLLCEGNSDCSPGFALLVTGETVLYSVLKDLCKDDIYVCVHIHTVYFGYKTPTA